MNPKDDLEQYEATEAKEVIRLLKTLSPSTVKSAPPSFEAKVLARLKDNQTRRKWFADPSWYQAPMSFAAGVIIGVVMIPYFQSQEIETLAVTTPTDFRGSNGVIKPADIETAEDWLELIADLIMTHQVDSANKQLQAFRKQYPDYEQNLAKP